MVRKAVFLDRDGVLNRSDVRGGRPYAPTALDAFVILPEVPAAVTRLRSAGFLAIVVTNQKDVGAGKTPRTVMEAMHTKLRNSVTLDAIKVCTCTDDCPCYKPNTGMLDEAAKEFSIDLGTSYMVGDRWRDIDCGARAGCRTVFIDRGYEETLNAKPDFVAADLAEAAGLILADSGNAT
jgi:D-glycero-D-manno-heptose 1,7-bisphosphate phosphatase